MVRNIIRKIGYASSILFLTIYSMNQEVVFKPLPQEKQFLLICADGATIYPAPSLCAALKNQSELISQEIMEEDKKSIHLTNINGEQLLKLFPFIETVSAPSSLSTSSSIHLMAKKYISLDPAQREEIIYTASMLQCHALHKLLCLVAKKSNL